MYKKCTNELGGAPDGLCVEWKRLSKGFDVEVGECSEGEMLQCLRFWKRH